MKKSEEKKKLIEELASYYKKLNVEKLYIAPNDRTSKDWLAEVASILKNLDESDYQEFIRLRKSFYPEVFSLTRQKAAHELEGFVRQKVAEYQRYDFTYLDKKLFNFPIICFPAWLTRNIEKIAVTITIAAVLTWLGLS